MASTVIFGPSGKTIEGETEAFCIAKMIRLMGPLGEPDQAKQDIVDEFTSLSFWSYLLLSGQRPILERCITTI